MQNLFTFIYFRYSSPLEHNLAIVIIANDRLLVSYSSFQISEGTPYHFKVSHSMWNIDDKKSFIRNSSDLFKIWIKISNYDRLSTKAWRGHTLVNCRFGWGISMSNNFLQVIVLVKLLISNMQRKSLLTSASVVQW